jgi:chaperonin GroES
MSVTNTSEIYPVGYRVLVKPDPIKEMTEGGILIPENQREDHTRAQATGIIVACGEFSYQDWPRHWVKAGDRVLYSKHAGTHLTGADGEHYRLLNDEQITCIIGPNIDLSDFGTREKF